MMHQNSHNEGSLSSSSEALFNRIQNPQNARASATEMVPPAKQNPLDTIPLNNNNMNSISHHNYSNVSNPYHQPPSASECILCQCNKTFRLIYDILVFLLLLYCAFGVTFLLYQHFSSPQTVDADSGMKIAVTFVLDYVITMNLSFSDHRNQIECGSN